MVTKGQTRLQTNLKAPVLTRGVCLHEHQEHLGAPSVRVPNHALQVGVHDAVPRLRYFHLSDELEGKSRHALRWICASAPQKKTEKKRKVDYI